MATRIRLFSAGWEQPLLAEPFEPPTPGPGQVLVEVEACGVCYRDLIDRAGRFPWLQLPLTPGHEAAGRVVACGEGSLFSVGDRVATLHRDHCGVCPACMRGETSLCPSAAWVFGLMVDGGYATHLLANDSALYANPLLASHGCILHCTAGTAWRGLVRGGGAASGARVLIVGANGGVGAAGIQVAKRLGCSVTAVVRDQRHRSWLERLGADEILIDPGDGFHKQVYDPFDVVLDCVGSPTFNSSLRSVRMGGSLVLIGNISETRASFNLGYAIVGGLKIVGSSGATAQDMQRVLALHAAQPFDFTSLIDRTLPLEDAEKAQRQVLAGGLEGRIVLTTHA